MFKKYTLIIIALFPLGCGTRETVLHGMVRIPDNIIVDIPAVPRCCLHGELMEINGTTLFVEREGEGVPLVLLPGGPGATHYYFHPFFHRAAGFAEIIYQDPRGCGLSGRNSKSQRYSTALAVEDLDSLRAALGFDTWVVAGHSWGGLLAQIYAHRYPGRVSGLVLICSGISFERLSTLKETRELDYLSIEEQRRIMEIAGCDTLSRAQRIYNRMLAGDWKRQNFYRPAEEDMAGMALYGFDCDLRYPREVLSDAFVFEPDGTLEEYSIPILILEAEWDLTWNLDKPAALLEQYPGASMVVFQQAGHEPFCDCPNEFFAVLEEFCGSLDDWR